jgi:glycosyltransferase involved in cell wall biosynthesis
MPPMSRAERPHAPRAGASPVPRRVLMTVDAVGGVWAYAVDLAAALVARSVAVTFAVMGPPPSTAQRAEARHAGVDVEVLPCRLEWMEDPWDDVDRAGEWLLEMERAWRPDIVHVNGFAHASLPWRAPAVLVGHSCVCSWWRAVHGTSAPKEWDEYRRRVSRGLRDAAMVIVPSRGMGAALRQEYGAIPALRVVANARSLRARCDVGEKEPFVFSAGRMWDEAKNIVALCEAAPGLGWPVYVAGDAAFDGSRGRSFPGVHLLGRLESADVAAWLSRASIYALPARYEPFGLSVLEAAIAGCALVLGDIPTLRENWEGAAVFVPPGDSAALAATIQRLIAGEPERTRWAELAAERARGFSVDRMAGQCLAAYGEVLLPVVA